MDDDVGAVVRFGSTAATAVLVLVAQTARAERAPVRFDVPAGALGSVATALGVQARVTITITDPRLSLRRSRGVRGMMTLRAALDRALAGTGARAIVYDPRTIRLVLAPVAPAARPFPRAAAPSTPPPPDPPQGDIVVTATKQASPLDRYPGSVQVVQLDRTRLPRVAAGGTLALAQMLPTLATTNLGPARNKLFIRGIADSSFTGPTQATVGQYLGDVRLNYNAPDPNLNLYDMERVEMLVGPQGTLYGASSLGGVLRLVPHAPETDTASATMAGGVSATRHGGVGGDLAAMGNVPIITGKLAVRLVGFVTQEAGYIDAPLQGRRNVNVTQSVGQRLAVRADNLGSWTVDGGLVIQNSANRDGQSTRSGDPLLTSSATTRQPFRNDYYLAYVAARGPVGEAELVTTTSMVSHRLSSVFDTGALPAYPDPTVFRENNRIVLLTHETRVSGGGVAAPWVAGFASIFNASVLLRTIGPPGEPGAFTGVVNEQLEAAAFGQLSRPLSRTLTGMVGGRLTISRSTGRVIEVTGISDEAQTRGDQRFSSTLALDWHPDGPLSGFFHYQQGYRAGGLAISPTGGDPAGQRFAADGLNMNEIGLRYGKDGRDPLVIRAAVFAADWTSMQADLIDQLGLPYTTNIGRGRIAGLDTQVAWRLAPGLTLSAAAFVNTSTVVAPAGAPTAGGSRALPNVAPTGERIALAWRGIVAGERAASVDMLVRYVGRSRLGVGSQFDVPQGGYVIATLGGRIDFGAVGVSLDIENLGDVRGNSFAFGNPFGVMLRDQVTPLRPRTIRLGLETRF